MNADRRFVGKDIKHWSPGLTVFQIPRTDRKGNPRASSTCRHNRSWDYQIRRKITFYSFSIEHAALDHSAKQKNPCIMTSLTSQSGDENSQFGLANIPFGVVSTKADPIPKIATRLFDQVYLIPNLVANGHLDQLSPSTRSSLFQVWSFNDCLVRANKPSQL